MGIQRPDGPYSVEMTAGPAWPGADENTYRDRADELRATLRSLASTCEQWEQQRATLFNGDLVWSGDAASAAAAEVDKRTAAMHTLQDQLRTAATQADTTAAVIGAVKTQITENVETAHKIIDQINNTPAATAEQKSAAIQQVVTTTHATNTAAVAAGAAQLTAGQLRLAEANHIITTTTERLNTVASNLHQLTSRLPLTPPASGGPPVPQDNGEAHPTDPHATLSGIEEPNRELLEDLKKEYQQLPDGQIKTDRLADIAGIEKSLEVRDSHLIYIARPDDPSQMVPAAVSVGDPYAADHVSVTVPGVGSTTRKSLSTMTEEAAELKREADRISAAVVKVGQTPETVAAIAYMGYQPPLTMTSPEMLNDGLAQAGAPKLNAFLGDLNAAAKPGHTTALYGHSYGSLMSGLPSKRERGRWWTTSFCMAHRVLRPPARPNWGCGTISSS